MQKLSKRIDFYTLSLILGLLAGLYIFVSSIYKEKEYPNYVHTTLYLDRTFDDFEEEAIMEAAVEWATVTNHVVDFDVVKLPANNIDLDNSVIITKVTPDYPMVIVLDTTNDNSTLGYCDNKYIIPHIALVNERISNEDYKPVVMHELGHHLGLKHNEGLDNLDSLMFPSRGVYIKSAGVFLPSSNIITHKDGVNFCKLYHCDPNKLQYQEESLHP